MTKVADERTLTFIAIVIVVVVIVVVVIIVFVVSCCFVRLSVTLFCS